MNNNFNEQLDKTLNLWGAPKETLVEIVEAYQNNELGSTNSNNSNENNSSDTTGSNAGCDCTDKLSSLQNQINELTLEINQTTEKLNLLLNKLYDRSAIYNTSYDHIDTSVLFRTYDFIEKEKNLSTTYNTSTYPVGLFCLNATETTIKLTLNIKATSTEGTGQISLFVNGTSIATESLENITLEEQKYEFYFTASLLDTGNYLETVVYTTDGNPITITYIKYEAYNCTNPTFINIDSRFNVDYYDGNYYISDCSGTTAKYSIVPTDTFNSLNDLNWTDSGIEAISYRFLDNLISEGTNYYHDPNVSNFYIKNNNTFVLTDVNNNKTYTEKNIIYADVLHPLKGELNVVNTATSGRIITTNIYIFKDAKSRSYSQLNKASKYYMIYGLKNYLEGFSKALEKSLYVFHTMNNNLIFSYKNITCELGYGTFISGYVLNQNPLQVEIYTKVHDYCIKHNITYTSPTGTPKLESYTSEVCGTYDKFFKGIKNDYFTVEDGVWHYYQSDLLES